MKQLFGFILLVGVALLLLTVISGIGGVFSAISATWTNEQTALIATGLSTVLYFGGIVTVSVLGYGLFVNMSKGGKGWSSRPQQPDQYHVIDAPQQNMGMLGMKQEDADWYDFQETEQHEARYR